MSYRRSGKKVTEKFIKALSGPLHFNSCDSNGLITTYQHGINATVTGKQKIGSAIQLSVK